MRSEMMASAKGEATARQAGRPKTAALPAVLLAAVAWLELHLERRRSRRALLRMTDAQLKDIGLSRSTAYAEANRPFWD